MPPTNDSKSINARTFNGDAEGNAKARKHFADEATKATTGQSGMDQGAAAKRALRRATK